VTVRWLIGESLNCPKAGWYLKGTQANSGSDSGLNSMRHFGSFRGTRLAQDGPTGCPRGPLAGSQALGAVTRIGLNHPEALKQAKSTSEWVKPRDVLTPH